MYTQIITPNEQSLALHGEIEALKEIAEKSNSEAETRTRENSQLQEINRVNKQRPFFENNLKKYIPI